MNRKRAAFGARCQPVRAALGRVAPLALVALSLSLVTAVFAWRYDVVYVHGGSMEPALSSGDVAVVDTRDPVQAGDIVLFREPGHSAVLHRALERRRGGWTTKGDANPVVDRTRAADSWLRGSVRAVLPVGRLLSRWQADASCDTLSAQPNSKRH